MATSSTGLRALLVSSSSSRTRLGRHAPHQARMLQAAALLSTTYRPGTCSFRHSPPPTQRRPFSVVSAVADSITTTQHLWSGLHALTGTPWYLTIPLVALTINLATRLPITIYLRTLHRRRMDLQPLMRAWANHLAVVVHSRAAGPSASPEAKRAKHAALLQKVHRRLCKSIGAQAWKDYANLAILPIWLVNIEALRRLCGGPKGMIGTFLFGRDTQVTATTTTTTPDDFTADFTPPPPPTTTPPLIPDAATTAADPSLALQGCLWFPDLTVADPLHILPLALSAVLLVNIVPRSREGLLHFLGTGAAPVTWRTRLQRSLALVALAIGPVTMDLPAALHLYWISSSAITLAVTELTHRLMPVRSHVSHDMCRAPATFVFPKKPAKGGR